jgi:hypothetical protein
MQKSKMARAPPLRIFLTGSTRKVHYLIKPVINGLSSCDAELIVVSVTNHLPKELSHKDLSVQKLLCCIKKVKILYFPLLASFITDIISQYILGSHVEENN